MSEPALSYDDGPDDRPHAAEGAVGQGWTAAAADEAECG
jgi:hypothetical protein